LYVQNLIVEERNRVGLEEHRDVAVANRRILWFGFVDDRHRQPGLAVAVWRESKSHSAVLGKRLGSCDRVECVVGCWCDNEHRVSPRGRVQRNTSSRTRAVGGQTTSA